MFDKKKYVFSDVFWRQREIILGQNSCRNDPVSQSAMTRSRTSDCSCKQPTPPALMTTGLVDMELKDELSCSAFITFPLNH